MQISDFSLKSAGNFFSCEARHLSRAMRATRFDHQRNKYSMRRGYRGSISPTTSSSKALSACSAVLRSVSVMAEIPVYFAVATTCLNTVVDSCCADRKKGHIRTETQRQWHNPHISRRNPTSSSSSAPPAAARLVPCVPSVELVGWLEESADDGDDVGGGLVTWSWEMRSARPRRQSADYMK